MTVTGGRFTLTYGDVKDAFIAAAVLAALATPYAPAVVGQGWGRYIFVFVGLSICFGLLLGACYSLVAIKWYEKGRSDGFQEGYLRGEAEILDKK